jgi:hypothetical protein
LKEHRETLKNEEERINGIKKQYIEDNAEFHDAQKLLNEKQEEIDRLDEQEYKRRNSGNAGSIIPSAIKSMADLGYGSGGAVSGTDSESESEFQQKIKGKRVDKVFKWTPEYEEMLEEILMKH